MRHLLVFAVLFAAAPVRAQAPVVNPLRFTALDVGNRWEYVWADHIPAVPVVLGYYVATVDGEVTVSGQPHVVLTTQRFRADRTPESPRYTCAYSPTLGTAPAGATTLPDYRCSVQFALPPPLPWRDGPTTVTPATTVEVSVQQVAVDSLLSLGSQGGGSGGSYTTSAYRYATRIGNLGNRTYGRYHQGTGGGLFDRRETLSYARVGGVVYGASAVAGEADAAGEAFALAVGPNPSAGAFRVSVSGTDGPVEVEVFDTLGRRVARGTGGGFAFAPESAGVYIVRATDASGRTVTRHVVRR